MWLLQKSCLIFALTFSFLLHLLSIFIKSISMPKEIIHRNQAHMKNSTNRVHQEMIHNATQDNNMKRS
jgi:hypothetical protein